MSAVLEVLGLWEEFDDGTILIKINPYFGHEDENPDISTFRLDEKDCSRFLWLRRQENLSKKQKVELAEYEKELKRWKKSQE